MKKLFAIGSFILVFSSIGFAGHGHDGHNGSNCNHEWHK